MLANLITPTLYTVFFVDFMDTYWTATTFHTIGLPFTVLTLLYTQIYILL